MKAPGIVIGFSALCIIVAISSCRTTQNIVDTKDLSYLYNPSRNTLNPQYNIYNQSEEVSVLSIKFFSKDLFFSQANPQGIPASLMIVTVKLFNTTQGRVLADTASANLNIIQEEGRQDYMYNISLNVNPGSEYVAEIRILDRIRLHVIQAFVPFNTLSLTNRYNFRLLGHYSKNDLFLPVLRKDEFINLLYYKDLLDSIYISYYEPFREIPYAPSLLLPEKSIDYPPEGIFALPYSDTLPIMLSREGIYMFSVKRNINEGYAIFNFGPTYPEMTTPEVMIEPLIYLATENEMFDLRTALKPKAALDEFWLKCGGNIDKSRELIRIYYNRVQFANYYFTSFREGWRSDRGMIYIIYGPPDKVYKTTEGESWGYRKPEIKTLWGNRYRISESYLFFNFRKNENIFSDNDYVINRSETLVSYWDQAIASWKKGIVFRLDNPEDL